MKTAPLPHRDVRISALSTTRSSPQLQRSVTSARAGSALPFAIIILILLECVMLGTVHLSVLEHRLAQNGTTALRLRLGAEGAAAMAAVQPGALGTGVGAIRVLDAVSHDGLILGASAERLAQNLVMITAEARLPSPHYGRAATALLAFVPVLNPSSIVAAVHVGSGASVSGTGSIVATGTAPCGSGYAVALTPGAAVAGQERIDGGVIGAASGESAEDVVNRARARPVHAALTRIDGDWIVTGPTAGAFLIDGNAHLLPGANVSGIVIIAGSLTMSPGAAITGTVFVAGSAEVQGRLHLDMCVAGSAADAARLTSAMPLPGRSQVPVF